MRDRQTDRQTTDGRQTTDVETETEGCHTKCASLIKYVCFCSLTFLQYLVKCLAEKNVSKVAYFVSVGIKPQLNQTRSHPEMVGDMLHVTLNFDLSKIPFVHF